MEVNLFKKNKEVWTRFKIGVKEIKFFSPKLLLELGEPARKSSRFYYWERKGDFLNGKNLD